MSQIGGYELHVYCDVDGCNRYPTTDVFAGHNAGDCRDQARKAGWILSRKDDKRDVCPECHISRRRRVFKPNGHFEDMR